MISLEEMIDGIHFFFKSLSSKGLGTFKKITNMDIDKEFLTELFK